MLDHSIRSLLATIPALALTLSVSAQNDVVIEQSTSTGLMGLDYGIQSCITRDGGSAQVGWGGEWNVPPEPDMASNNVCVVRLDRHGEVEWKRSYGGNGLDEGYGIDETKDGGLVFAGFTNSTDGQVTGLNGQDDVWVGKLDGAGELQWQRTLGGPLQDAATIVYQTNDEGFIVGAGTEADGGDVLGHHGANDIWVVKLDAQGTLEWQRCLGGTANDELGNVRQTADGGYIVAGATESSDGDVSVNLGANDLWIVKLDAGGAIEWEHSYGGSSQDRAHDVRQTADGGYIAVGYTNSPDGDVSNFLGWTDVWVVKLDATGTLEWEQTYGGVNNETGYSVTTSRYGGYYVAATAQFNSGQVSGMQGNGDYWILEITSDGSLVWARGFGGPGQDWPFALHERENGNLFVAGYSDSEEGDIELPNGGVDFWSIDLAPRQNKINGTVFVDLDADAILDASEVRLANHAVREPALEKLTLTREQGSYSLPVSGPGDYTVDCAPLANYTAQPATHAVTFTGLDGVSAGRDFAMQPAGIVNDLLVHTIPVTRFRPGLEATYELVCSNIGTTTLDASLELELDPLLTFTSASLTPTSVQGNTFSWNIGPLAPFVEAHVLVVVTLDTQAQVGTSVISTGRVLPIVDDVDPANNVRPGPAVITVAYDPNDIEVDRAVLHPDEVADTPWLEYTIRFQNTGNDTAFTVRIKDPLPLELQAHTFELIAASHPVQVIFEEVPRVLWFEFDQILLPDSNVNEPLSHGYLRYRIRPRADLLLGDSIRNAVDIFFDFNAPVRTNTAITEVALPTAIDAIEDDQSVSVQPNPTSDRVQVGLTLPDAAQVKIGLYSATGQLLLPITDRKHSSGPLVFTVDLAPLPTGIHHLRVQVDGKVITRMVVKL